MKIFKASQLALKPAEVFAEARKEGAIIQQCRTNGEVVEEFVIMPKDTLDEFIRESNTLAELVISTNT